MTHRWKKKQVAHTLNLFRLLVCLLSQSSECDSSLNFRNCFALQLFFASKDISFSLKLHFFAFVLLLLRSHRSLGFNYYGYYGFPSDFKTIQTI